MGAIAALEADDLWFENLNTVYRNRRNIVWQIADKLGFNYDKNAEGFFVWTKLPKGSTAYEVADTLLYENNIFVTPGSIFGTNGDQYVRFSLCIDETKLKEALQRVGG
jgi:aspartate/methionine/tyrosine aminotransferase